MGEQSPRPSRGGRAAAPRQGQGQTRRRDQEGPIPALAMAAGGVDSAVSRGRVTPTVRATFQAVALLLRELRDQIKAADLPEVRRAEQVKRVEGLATALAKTATRDVSLLALLADDTALLPGTSTVLRELRAKAGMAEPEVPEPVAAESGPTVESRRVIPDSVRARMLANPFLAPDYAAAPAPKPPPRLLADWELLQPLLRAFETTPEGASSCMTLPPPGNPHVRPGLELMPHQAGVVAATNAGHRTFLLADEPGLGKTAQALLAAESASAYPLLIVVPNVVKTSWAREAAMWTPSHPATVVHSDGEDIDAFSDIVVVNYDILDRHADWIGRFGFRGMVIDEAHFIKTKTSQRSRHVLDLSRKVRARSVRPLLMALTGTPLINDIDDFLAIWEFLGWIDGKEPGRELMHKLEENGLTPLDRDFYPAARRSVVEMGIVRRRKVDVAKDIPARRVADVPVELDAAAASSVLEAERRLVRRLVKRYESALAARREASPAGAGVDDALVRQICARELREANDDSTGENVFTMMRQIGRAKAELAADYTVQLSRNAGKVVFFARHIDVMDTAQDVLTRRRVGFASIRGDQTPQVRQRNVDAFVNDDDVHVAVCSLLAAGVGINLQVSSNVVLAELSWTAAEQTQAIDRVHRIGQDQPVTAWRIIAAQTIDARVAELVDAKAGLAARALDGSDEDAGATGDVRLATLVALLSSALAADPTTGDSGHTEQV